MRAPADGHDRLLRPGTLLTIDQFHRLVATTSASGVPPVVAVKPLLVMHSDAHSADMTIFRSATGLAIVEGLGTRGPIVVKCYSSEALAPLEPSYEADVFADFVDEFVAEPLRSHLPVAVKRQAVECRMTS